MVNIFFMKKINSQACRLMATGTLAVIICMIQVCNAQAVLHQSLLALSKEDHTLAIVDPLTLKVVARIPVGEDPHEVIASSDGKTAYVSIYGGGSLHELDIIDLVAQKPLTKIDTRPLFGPHGLTFVNGKTWFTAEGSKSVGRYDPATGKLDWSMGTGEDRTHMIYVSDNEKRVYTTTLIRQGPPPGGMKLPSGKRPAQGGMRPPPGGGFHETWEQTIVPTAKGAEGFDVSPDSTELWTASSENGNIYIINVAAKKLKMKIDAKVFGANRLKFTPNGKLVFISSLQSGELSIYDATTRREIKRLKIGNGAAGILMEPDGSRAFIGCTADNYIAVIDLKTLTVTSHIDVGGGPDGLAWAIQH
jgi:YVTN family beta-propeller protein